MGSTLDKFLSLDNFLCKPGRLLSDRARLSPQKAPELVLQTQDLSLLKYTKAGGSACWTLKFLEDLAEAKLLEPDRRYLPF